MLKIWNQRKLTIFGKVTVINMLEISINVPEWVIMKLEKKLLLTSYGRKEVELIETALSVKLKKEV